jgi:nucleoside-diphosphate-sugar epimerase
VKVLVTGAGGFLGLAVVRALADRGADAVGLVHSAGSGPGVVAAGGTIALGDVLDLSSVERASRGCDTIVHLAAAHAEGPEGLELARRVRVEGAHHVIRAARAHGVRRLVIGSGYWVYRSHPGVISETSPLEPRGESRINYDTERAGLEANAPGDLDVLVVRPGMVYGNGSWFTSVRDAVREGTYRLIGDGSNHWSFVARSDAGVAFLRVIERGATGEVYNVVDGRPATWGEFAGFVASGLQRPPPESLAFDQAVLEVGSDVAHHLIANRAVSAAKLEGLGWHPRYPSFREGIGDLLREMADRSVTRPS